MRRLALVLLLVGLSAEAAGKNPVALKRGNSPRGAVPVEFVVASTLCDVMGVGNQAGAWWCLENDGTMFPGSAITLSAVNTPVAVPHLVCPSGTNCTSETQMRMNPILGGSVQYFLSPVTTVPTGSFTTCALGSYDQTQKNSGSGPQTPWVLLHDLVGGITWSLETPAGDGSTGVTVNCLPGTCGPISNNVQVYVRNSQLNCGVFEAGVRTRSCTFVQGATPTTTCVDTPHVLAQVTQTARRWTVGIDSTMAIPWKGFMRGAFMTEKALSAAEITAIGRATIIGAPAGETYARASKASCCRTTDGQCTDLNNDVPCIINGVATVNPVGQNKVQGSERIVDVWATDGFNGTTTALNGCISPYGLQTADRVNYAANSAANQYERTYQQVSYSGAGTRTHSIAIMATGATVSGTLDLCTVTAVGVNACTTCPFTTTWSRCRLTYSTLLASNIFLIGNLPDYNGGTQRPAQSVCLTNGQGEESSTETSYINTGTAVGTGFIRAAESCSGSACP